MVSASLAEVVASLAFARLIADYTLRRPISKVTAAVLVAAQLPLIGWAAGIWQLSHYTPPAVARGILLAPLAMLLAGGVWLGVRLRSGCSPALGYARGAALALCTLPLAWLGPHWAPDAQIALRVWLLALGHLAGCYLDCRGRAAGLDCCAFGRHLALALAYVAPAAPLLIVGASVALLFGTSTMRLLGLRPDALRWLVNWGSLHAPFWFVHLHTRRASEGFSMLPVSVSRGGNVISRLVR